MIKNKELDLAMSFIENTDRNLFITGKAGTGKTTFLRKIKSESLKRMVVVAPTGVAAINAQGVTIHSFFQMPFGPIVPNQTQQIIQRKFSRTKIDIIRSLDMVIIDEISMVRADLLDGIDQVLRRYKDRNKVFGGVQVVMIGDLQQLAPVVKPNDWNLLKAHYKTVYFFSSKAFQQAQAVSIELKHIYRQKNEAFIKILNEIRKDELSESSINILNQRFQPNFEPKDDEGYITLTTHNNRARRINESKLEKLDEESHFFQADIEGNFSESSYPNKEQLELKVGAQVMFIKNDSSPEKRYFNGKIGTVVDIYENSITVQCKDDDEHIEVGYEKWDNIRYSIEEETKEIREEIVGMFSQIPLQLAWAITIHKSQGLTFDKAIIDAGSSFAHGQTYVAMSRCTSLEGIVLKTQIGKHMINDHTVKSFSDDVAENAPNEDVLKTSKIHYQLNLIEEIFNYQAFLYPVKRMQDMYYKNRNTLHGSIIHQLETIKDKGVVPLMKVAHGFQKQIRTFSENQKVFAEESDYIQERLKKAVSYFTEQTQEHIQKPLEELTFSSDNKAVKKEFKKQFETLSHTLQVKVYTLSKLHDGFKVNHYLKVRADAVLEESETPKKKSLQPTSDSALAVELRELRNEIALAENIPHFQVYTQEALYGICDLLPQTLTELKKVKGMGKIRVQKYGEEILEVVKNYCIEKGLTSKKQKKASKEKKASHLISLEAFQNGRSVSEIAQERNLTENTILSHLIRYIPSGEVDVSALISPERCEKLVKAINDTEFESLKELKDALGEDYSYTELRIVLKTME
jgi:hypothetical protein